MISNCDQALEIFWGSGSPYAWRVLMTAELKGVQFVSSRLEFSEKEHKAPSFLKINRRGEVPALRHGGYLLTESLAIMAYLDVTYPEPPLFGDDAESTGQVWQWISFALYHLEPLADQIVNAVYRGTVADDAKNIHDAVLRLLAEWAYLEDQLSNGPWLVGETVSAADVVIHTDLEFFLRIAARPVFRELSLGFEPVATTYPSIAVWLERTRALRGYNRAYPPHWKTTP